MVRIQLTETQRAPLLPDSEQGPAERRPGKEAEVACGGTFPPGPRRSASLFLSPSLFFLSL